MAAGDAFDVRKWMATRGRAADAAVVVTQPRELTVWTKTSRRDGGRFLFGDASGASACGTARASRAGRFCQGPPSAPPGPSGWASSRAPTQPARPFGGHSCAAPAPEAPSRAPWSRAKRASPTAATPGLQTFSQPKLPADLNEGFPDRYTAKDEAGPASPVDTIVEAASGAGVDWAVRPRAAPTCAAGSRIRLNCGDAGPHYGLHLGSSAS
jgi:hypothetical protein